VTQLADLIHRVDRLFGAQDWQGAYEAALTLWQYPAYQKEISDVQVRHDYASALDRVSRLFYELSGPYEALAPLKRAYVIGDVGILEGSSASPGENAAWKLGEQYEAAKCHHSAVEWFGRTLALAREAGATERILSNLYRLAQNLENLGLHEQAGPCYSEILEKLSGEPVQQHPDLLVPAAMYQIYHGDPARGEALMRILNTTMLGGPADHRSRMEPLEVWFLAALRALGLYFASTGRPGEAMELARTVRERADQFRNPCWARDTMHGLAARALVHMGRLDDAMAELTQVLDEEQEDPTIHLGECMGERPVEIMELWGDIARIHFAERRYERAMNAYEILVHHISILIADRHMSDTTRLRFYWLQRQAMVVHEMASAWLMIAGEEARQEVVATVANALLQLKANLFITMEAHRLDALKYSTGDELFLANRRYAAAARKVFASPNNPAAMLELEDALFRREEIERGLLTGDMIPSMAGVLRFNFLGLMDTYGDALLLDYSLIGYRPPQNGLPGPVQGLRYVGVRLAEGDLKIVDLGDAEPIETLCRPYIQALSRKPLLPGQLMDGNPDSRTLRPSESKAMDLVDLDQLSERVYDRLVAPFEPLKDYMLLSPDGLLAAIPFHALVRDDRYLVEDRDIVYCHSLLQKDSLSTRQRTPGRQAVPNITRSALLLGNPNYSSARLPSLPGAKLEMMEVANLLQRVKFQDGVNVFEEVHLHTGRQATAVKLLDVPWPRVLHIAAHGDFDESNTRLFAVQPVHVDGSYRRWEEMGAQPLTALDNALVNSTLILAEDPVPGDDPADSAILTALELASLNLIGCHVVVLSACETGAGGTEYGVGVLGFQYGLLASFTRTGLLSLWNIPDRETATFMVDFYRNFLGRHSPIDGYMDTVRTHCRRNGQRVYPYYWAAFVLLDQEYENPVF
jgi:CHAT domain-containing protein/tetratricopeptide (TPR) repeat protein